MENGEENYKENTAVMLSARGGRPYGLWFRDFRNHHPYIPCTVGDIPSIDCLHSRNMWRNVWDKYEVQIFPNETPGFCPKGN